MKDDDDFTDSTHDNNPCDSDLVVDQLMTVKAFAEHTHQTEKAVRHKINDGVWPERQVYFRAPDGRLFVSLNGWKKWVTGTANNTPPGSGPRTGASKSGSSRKKSPGDTSDSPGTPPQLT